jgi:hypothetical protein
VRTKFSGRNVSSAKSEYLSRNSIESDKKSIKLRSEDWEDKCLDSGCGLITERSNLQKYLRLMDWCAIGLCWNSFGSGKVTRDVDYPNKSKNQSYLLRLRANYNS